MIAPMISNCDRPREPPPSIGDMYQSEKRQNEAEEVRTETSKLECAA
jgi:hypothetical protein